MKRKMMGWLLLSQDLRKLQHRIENLLSRRSSRALALGMKEWSTGKLEMEWKLRKATNWDPEVVATNGLTNRNSHDK